MNLETISPSRITSYLQCARKFAFRYVEKIPPAWKAAALAFGSAVHTSLQVFHERRRDNQPVLNQEIISLFCSDWQAQREDDLTFKEGDTPDKLRDLGVVLINLYLQENQNLQVRAVEWPFETPLLDLETGEVLGPKLHGVFDLLLPDNGLVEIKTAARAFDEGTLSRNLQFSAYAYGYRQLFQQDPLIKVVALLKQVKKPRIETYPVIRTRDDDAWFVQTALEVVHGIEAEVFPPNPGWPCSDCEYLPACSAWKGRKTVAISNSQPQEQRPEVTL